MRVDDFDFALPDDLIALRPASPRGTSRMLVVYPDGKFVHTHVNRLQSYLQAGDALVLNDTKVIPAQLVGTRTGRGQTAPRISVTLHKRMAGDRYRAFAKPARKILVGDRLELGRSLVAHVRDRGEGGEVELQFELSDSKLDDAIASEGLTPLPPYIASKRPIDARDTVDYQTVYARHGGSVAAPTAGLHFSQEHLQNLADAGVSLEKVTLHVGAGTFLPVTAEDVVSHRMHSERARLTLETATRLNAVRSAKKKLCAVGTTSARTLESAVDDGGKLCAFDAETNIFIAPGYRFRAVDMLLTNFHLPRSTLFMLVSAFSGLETMRRAYAEAIRERYRFYSYGDACLLLGPI